MTHRDALIFANEVFYVAFQAQDISQMQEIWASDQPIYCLHPGWTLLDDYEEIIESWQSIFEGPAPPKVEFRMDSATIYGETGIVLGYELIDGSVLAVTNYFVHTGSTWRLVHHQAGQTLLSGDEIPEFAPDDAPN